MKKNVLLLLFIILAASFISPYTAQASALSSFQSGNIIDDVVFTDYGRMSLSNIQDFLSSKVPACDTHGSRPASDFGRSDITRAQYAALRGWQAPPYTCLKDYSSNGKTSAQIIYDTAQKYNINPQVFIVLLQKESSLVTDTWPLDTQYRSATGYGCPDSTPGLCDSSYYGFSNQVDWAGKMFRAIMNNSPTWYTPYVLGNNIIQYNPSVSCGSSVVNIQNRATQALYNYTPYQPNSAALSAGYSSAPPCGAYGNRNFYLYFNDWFGSTQSAWSYACRYGENLPGAPYGQTIIKERLSSSKNSLTVVIPNNTGSKCTEIHTWGDATLTSWSRQIPTTSYTFDQRNSKLISSKRDSQNSLITKVDYTGTASGRVEFHTLTQDGRRWQSHIATTAGPIDPSLSEVISADLDGNGNDEYYLINYQQTNSGMVEVHGWGNGGASWFRHTATNLPATSLSEGEVIPGDINGDGIDELTYVKYANTQSGRIEFHTWDKSLNTWISHIASNYPVTGFDRIRGEIISSNTYGSGNNDLFSMVLYSGTASGKVEVHTWSLGQQSWLSHVAASLSAF